ncbi:ABC transporter ATP-binding protein [Bdellovibrio bacteriovorus]|uniref:ABC transporter ATP-binding protein n=1 Tax=Bdellovibrio bacteriovorus TaxID=959 RepID=UPI0035A5A6CB
MNSVEVQNLSVKFGDYYAVKDISFTVEKGEIFGFLGANGAGKTTTIRVLCGLLLPSQGEARVCGLDVQRQAFEVKKKVGYMSQKFTLYDDMTVAENLTFTASLRKLPDQQVKMQKERLLEFIRFKASEKTLVKDLPGGIKQQVSLVSSLLHDPEIVFLDEPTAGVSPAYRQRFWSLIRALGKEGKTVFVTTHYMDEAEQCHRIALMRSGELIALNSAEGLKAANFPDRNPHDVSLEEVFIAEVEGR